VNPIRPADRMPLTRRLARLRVPLGFLCGAIVIWLARPTRKSLVIGVAIAAAGELLRIWAAGHLEKGREVTQSGPYRWFRHPLYVGSTIMGAGLAIAAWRPSVAVLIALYLAVTIGAAIRTENAYLHARFGHDYEQWRAGQGGRVVRAFSLQRALRNREHRAVAGLLIATCLLVLRATW
jgi:Phospholipid methyltransferase